MKLYPLIAITSLIVPLTGCMPTDCSSLAKSVMKKSYKSAVANDEYLRRVIIADSPEQMQFSFIYTEKKPRNRLGLFIDGKGKIINELWEGNPETFTYTTTQVSDEFTQSWHKLAPFIQPKIQSEHGISCEMPIQRSTDCELCYTMGTISQDNQNWSYK